MTAHENATLVRRWFDEVWNERRDATVHELLDPAAMGHLEGLVTHNVAEFFAARSILLNAFPDLRVSVEGILAEEMRLRCGGQLKVLTVDNFSVFPVQVIRSPSAE